MAADAITIKNELSLTADVQLPAGYAPGSSSDARTLNAVGQEWVYSANDATNPTAIYLAELTIPGGGSIDIDLETLAVMGAVDGDGEPADNEDMDGKRLIAFFFSSVKSTGANAGNVTVKPAAADGYDLFGTGIADGIIIAPNQSVGGRATGGNLPTVVNSGGGTPAHLITISGTAADTLRVVLVFEDV